jgi:hypothetical protein
VDTVQVMHGSGKHRHLRTRPGFVCCRAYDTDRQRVMPLPVPTARVNHKLVEEVNSVLQDYLHDMTSEPLDVHMVGMLQELDANVQTVRMTKLSKERLQSLEGKATRKRRRGSDLQQRGSVIVEALHDASPYSVM